MVVWSWQYLGNAFGELAADSDPDGDGTHFIFNLRFPGQQFDIETGLHYNYFRDYDPRTGRYMQSDPIGLRGGVNTYGYSLQSPLSWVDEKGLSPWDDAFGCSVNNAACRSDWIVPCINSSGYLHCEEMNAQIRRARARASDDCLECRVDCIGWFLAETFIGGYIEDRILKASVQRIADEFIRRGAKVFAKKVAFPFTAADGIIAGECVVNCGDK